MKIRRRCQNVVMVKTRPTSELAIEATDFHQGGKQLINRKRNRLCLSVKRCKKMDTTATPPTVVETTTDAEILINITLTEEPQESPEFYRGFQVFRWIILCGAVPVSVLGLAGNVLSVWTWNSRKRKTLVPLFQLLGIADIILLAANLAYRAVDLTHVWTTFTTSPMYCLRIFSQSLALNTTLAIGVFRWLAVAKPQRMRQVTSRQVRKACGGVVAWSGLLTALSVVEVAAFSSWSPEGTALWLTLNFLGLVLPTLLLLGFSLALLMMFRRNRVHHSHHHIDVAGEVRAAARRRQRRVTVTVLWISGFTCLTYPLATSLWAIMLLQSIGVVQNKGCGWSCYYTLFGVIVVLQVLNSSVNFLIYFFSASAFRRELRQKFRRVLACCCSANVGEEEGEKSSSVSNSRTRTRPRTVYCNSHGL